jgi:CBS domain containing-hemolysin-like protein
VAFHPVIVGLTVVSDWILRLLGVDTEGGEEAGSPDELKRLIAESYAGGHLDPGEAGMLTGVFHLHEQEARQIMTPIPAVITVDMSQDAETALRLCISSGHTRLVVIEDDNRDRVRGLVHASALARRLMEDGPQSSIEPIVHDAPIVPETKSLDDLLADLQRQRTSMAVVVDEYGRVVGIVTVEDIIEEVVGEIVDETDPTAGEVRRLSNGDWLVRGHVSIADLLDYGVELPVDSDAYNSVGGFVFAELGRLPRRGDTIGSGHFSLRVESVAHNRIETVRIRERRPVAAREESGERREAPPAG